MKPNTDLDVESRETSSTALLDALSKITTYQQDGWSVNVKPISVDNSAPLDCNVVLEHYRDGESRATRRVKIVPHWATHPRYGEPDVSLGYTVTDSKQDEYDGVYADYLTFREACTAVGELLGEAYKPRPRRVRNWRKTRRREDPTQIGNYEGLESIGDEAIDRLVEYVNEVGDDEWDEITRDDIEREGESWKDEILGRAYVDGDAGFHDLADLSLVLDHLLFDVEVESGEV